MTFRRQALIGAGGGIEPEDRIGDALRIEAFAHQVELALLEGAGDLDAR
jgi:hypothetical protein